MVALYRSLHGRLATVISDTHTESVSAPTEPTTVAGVLCGLVRDPWTALGLGWNYKSAVLSSLCRGALFYAANRSAGPTAALGALQAEVVFRFASAGFYGALTQAFRSVEPRRAAMAGALLVVPATGHVMELAVHAWRGTPELGRSIAFSIVFTAVSTAFHLFAMQRGVLVVGTGGGSLLQDLRTMPRLIGAFLVATVQTVRAAL